jgi:hypothetical protein
VSELKTDGFIIAPSQILDIKSTGESSQENHESTNK